MVEINRVVEGWVRERPGEWFWLYRRWHPELYRKDGEKYGLIHLRRTNAGPLRSDWNAG